MRHRRLALGTVAFMIAFSGCAPHLVRISELEPGPRTERYRAALAEREVRGAAVDAEIVLWARVAAAPRLLGAEARLLLAAPDAFRLRVGSLFGTALDLAARGDSITAYVPARRKALNLDASRDSLGLRRPGELAFRALTATWRPDAAAWAGAVWRDTLLRVGWAEAGDTLAIGVGSDGLPAWAMLSRPGGARVRVTYRAWDRSNGFAWPARIDFEDLNGDLRITCKVSRVRFASHSDSLRLAIQIPPSAERLTLAGLRHALERLGSL